MAAVILNPFPYNVTQSVVGVTQCAKGLLPTKHSNNKISILLQGSKSTTIRHSHQSNCTTTTSTSHTLPTYKMWSKKAADIIIQIRPSFQGPASSWYHSSDKTSFQDPSINRGSIQPYCFRNYLCFPDFKWKLSGECGWNHMIRPLNLESHIVSTTFPC